MNKKIRTDTQTQTYTTHGTIYFLIIDFVKRFKKIFFFLAFYFITFFNFSFFAHSVVPVDVVVFDSDGINFFFLFCFLNKFSAID